ncbi:hypothetical protein [Rhizobium redzepovicii]|uniref:hypothetical protein n=1 Tax=Rhizobium redzepovicii TaxID=2867518 RepID=UPI0028714A83|nr:hypothetical protein [Rhizobium redzepovicii]MDR9781725.1 hypothetical protein [Rhizobium redzepovicii]
MIDFEPKVCSITFDTHEAPLDACISGLGIGQASPELRVGQLVVICPHLNPIVGGLRNSRRADSPRQRYSTDG